MAGFCNHGLVRLSCFGHCLDLAISKCLALAGVQRVLGHCRTWYVPLAEAGKAAQSASQTGTAWCERAKTNRSC